MVVFPGWLSGIFLLVELYVLVIYFVLVLFYSLILVFSVCNYVFLIKCVVFLNFY